MAREPRLLGGEWEHGREPRRGRAEQMVEHGEAGFAHRRRDRIAIERVLADVEIERGQVDIHEHIERRGDALVVELGIGASHDEIDFDETVQHQPFELWHIRDSNSFVFVEMGE
jgi:hypothetical protein